jgi:hypothetical protein
MSSYSVKQIISGGQTGVDQAALRVAKMLNIRTGGWIPKGWKTDEGPAPWLGTEFGLIETRSDKYPPRTKRNVEMANGTIILGHLDSPGCKLTAKYCKDAALDLLKINHKMTLGEAVMKIQKFLRERPIFILNVAGNRESSYPGIGRWAETVLYEALKRDDLIVQ